MIRGTSGPGLGREDGSVFSLGHRGACALGAALKENCRALVFLDICSQGSQCPSLTHLPFLGDVKARGDRGDHPAQGTSRVTD